jgi:hypothetical protein
MSRHGFASVSRVFHVGTVQAMLPCMNDMTPTTRKDNEMIDTSISNGDKFTFKPTGRTMEVTESTPTRISWKVSGVRFGSSGWSDRKTFAAEIVDGVYVRNV